MDLEVYAIVHCGGKGRLNYPASNGSPTDRCQQLHNIAVDEPIKHEDSYALGRIHVNHVENA